MEIVSICKATIKPYFIEKKINKDEYKFIMKKVVDKVKIHVHNVESINCKKISDLTLAYIKKILNQPK